MDKYNEKLLSLVKPILNRLTDDRRKYLEEELNNVINNNQSIRLLIAYKIVKYLKKNNYYYNFRGNITSSYLAYELGIHNVDCYELNIIPEICYGIDYNNNYSINFNVGKKKIKKVLNYIDKAFKNKLLRLYSIYPTGKISLNEEYRIYIIDDSIKCNTKRIYENNKYYDCISAEDKFNNNNLISIIPYGHSDMDLIDDTIKLIKKNKGINNIDINNKDIIISKLCEYTDKYNIDKFYLSYFGLNEVNELIKILKPKSYNDLLKICGLYHSTNAWLNNQDYYINIGFTIDDIFGSRDDVYDYFITHGYKHEEAFRLMENVRKGRFTLDSINRLNEGVTYDRLNIFSKIKYLFSKAHIASYLNVDILIYYLCNEYKIEFLKALYNQYEDYDYFNKIRFIVDKNKLYRYLDFYIREKEIEQDKYYDEIIKGIKFRIYISGIIGEEDLNYEELDMVKILTKEEKINILKNNKIDKEEYLKRLDTKYIKNGIEKSFKEQYLKAEGNELDYKFFSPISSSRLYFELFSFLANDEDIIDIEFEYFLPGLKSIHGYKVPQPNMDVYYEDNDIHFVESKFTEISYNKKEDISKNYYDYYLDGNNNIDKSVLDICNIRFDGNLIFAKYFIKLVNDILNYTEEKELFNNKDWFNLKQEITHIFGIGQYIYIHKPTKNIKFTNLVYLFDNGISKLAYKFKSLVVNMMNKYINELGLNILFFYDFMYMQDYIETIDLNKEAYASNRKIKDILKEFMLKV